MYLKIIWKNIIFNRLLKRASKVFQKRCRVVVLYHHRKYNIKKISLGKLIFTNTSFWVTYITAPTTSLDQQKLKHDRAKGSKTQLHLFCEPIYIFSITQVIYKNISIIKKKLNNAELYSEESVRHHSPSSLLFLDLCYVFTFMHTCMYVVYFFYKQMVL